MKKFLVTILAIVYLSTATGATLHFHYCMGKFFSADMIKKDGCGKCGMAANEGCCKDEIKVLKVKDNHQLVSNEISFAPACAVVENQYNLSKSVAYNNAVCLTTNNNSPPHSPGKFLCILNCVFRL